MTRRRAAALIATLCCAGQLAPSRRADACSPQQLGWYGIAQVLPKTGATGVALDAPLVFQLNMLPSSELVLPKDQQPQTAAEYANYGLKVKVTDEATGREIAGAVPAGFGTQLVWRPSEAFAPGARYKVAARIDNLRARPANGQGEVATDFSFTAGSAVLPPLTNAGPLKVQLERFTGPVIEQCGCGPCPSPTDSEPAVQARVHLPAVSGGFTDVPYQARTVVTRDLPYDLVANPGGPVIEDDDRVITANTPNNPTEILVRLPNDPALATVCFVTEMRDAAGKRVATAPVCLAALRPAPPPSPSPSPSQPGGCDVAAAGEPSGTGPLALVVAWASWAAFLILRRARRQD